MVKDYYLEKDDRNALLKYLSPGQRAFLRENIQHQIKSKFINESFLDGSHWQVVGFECDPTISGKLKCECGRPLKNQYWLEDRDTHIVHKLGITHMTSHLGVPEKVARQIAIGANKINLGMDEILSKVRNHNYISHSIITFAKQCPCEWSKKVLLFADQHLPIYDSILHEKGNPYSHYVHAKRLLKTYSIDDSDMSIEDVFEKAKTIESDTPKASRQANETKQAYTQSNIPPEAIQLRQQVLPYFDYFGGQFDDEIIETGISFVRLPENHITTFEIGCFFKIIAEELEPGDPLNLTEITKEIIQCEHVFTNELLQELEDARHRLISVLLPCLIKLNQQGITKKVGSRVYLLRNDLFQI